MHNYSSLMSKDRTTMLIGIFFLAVLVFNFPLISIFGEERSLWGFPLLYIYFFIVWVVLIALVYFWVERQDKDHR